MWRGRVGAVEDDWPPNLQRGNGGTMSRLARRTADAVRLVREGHINRVAQSILTRVGSETLSLGLVRDVSVSFAAPAAKIPLDVRPLRGGEALTFLSLHANANAGDAAFALVERRLLDAGIGTCWVAVTSEGAPCYMQFLLTHRDNPGIRALWGDFFPTLGAAEALLEGAFTPEAYRGQGIMAHAMARIAESATTVGARRVFTFVAADNVPSLKGCKKAGFAPCLRRTEVWRWGRRRVAFEQLPDGTAYPFDEVLTARPTAVAP
jgi:GNAT superfamily N-acetyltransferase